MIVTVEQMKDYLRIDGEDEEETLKDLISIAETYLLNAGATIKDNEGNYIGLAQLAVKQLVVHWYENREAVGKSERLTFSLDNILTQLKFCYEEV